MAQWSDAFTVAIDTNLVSYGDWESTLDLLTVDLVVVDADDNVQNGVDDSDRHAAKWNFAGAPTGNYEAQVEVYVDSSVGFGEGLVCVRCQGNDGTYYVMTIQTGTTGNVRIQRSVASSSTTLDTGDATINDATFYTIRLRVTGTNPVVLTGYVDDTPIVSASDTDAARLTTGIAGFGFYAETNAELAFDDYLISTDFLNTTRSLVNGGLVNNGLVNNGLVH